MKNYVQRIVDVRPTLVLVEKTVSRIAQDMLLEHGITLVINVKSVSFLIFLLFKKKKITSFKFICLYGRYAGSLVIYFFSSLIIYLFLCCAIYIKSRTGGMVAVSLFKIGESQAGRKCD